MGKTDKILRDVHNEKTESTVPSFQTGSGLQPQPLYCPEDIDGDYKKDLGFPGDFPYTRGVYPTGYRGRLWTMRQYAGFATAEETNRRYKYLLKAGQTGLSVAFDLPTQIGYDSDHPLAHGEVGKCGVAISSLRDMETLFDGIPLDQVSTSMTINAPAAILLAMYIVVAEKQGVLPEKLRGTIQNDILKEYVARGTYIFPPRPSMRLVTDSFEYCSENLPLWNTISISGYHIREAGSTAIQELAFTFANAICYVQSAIEKGLNVDKIASRLSFFFNAHNDLLEEIAKFRAARRLWARIMRRRFGAKSPKSLLMRFHTQTAGCTLTVQQPHNNVVRVTLQALAAILGGTQSLHTNSMDEALSLPSEDAVRVALRTQQVLAHESGVINTNDPLAGSYYVEWLTNKIEEQALEYIHKIDEMGGVLTAIENGYIADEIHKSAYEYQKQIERHERVVVGVNRFEDQEKLSLNLLKVNPKVEEYQRGKLSQLKKERDNFKVKDALKSLKETARGSNNLLPPIIECVKAYCTLGEISDILRQVFGEYTSA